jgi:Putative zinc-finger
MTHEDIQSREVAEAYVFRRLSEPERTAFEDHYFSCRECFEQVETLQKFADGVRDAAESGVLPAVREVTPPPSWFRPAFLLACAASLFLAILAGWASLIERPRLAAEAARQRQEADAGRQRVAELERAMAQPKSAPSISNLPLIMLVASRADAGTAVTVPAAAGQLALWVEPPPSAASTQYRLEISSGGKVIETLDGLVRNSYGALAVSVPALTPGSYQTRLYAKSNLVGEYRFEVRR